MALEEAKVAVNEEERVPVFCYGSNSTKQLRERVLNDSLQSFRCYLPRYRRIYCGYSNRWNGGAASIMKLDTDSEVCYGTIVYLTETEQQRLDRFEGIDEGNDPYSSDSTVNVYRREWVEIVSVDDEGSKTTLKALAYVKNDHDWKAYPSDAYLLACYNNIIPFWPEIDGHGAIKIYNDAGDLLGEYNGPN